MGSVQARQPVKMYISVLRKPHIVTTHAKCYELLSNCTAVHLSNMDVLTSKLSGKMALMSQLMPSATQC